MNFNDLQQNIRHISGTFRQNAIAAVNTHLTVRNWLVGFYIVEFEQNGEDRAKYGAKLLQNLADAFDEEGLSYRNLNLYRQFYLVYPQISVYIPYFFQKYFGEIGQSPIAQLDNSEKDNPILQTLSAQFKPEEIAVTDSDRELFVSKYIVELPDKKELERFVDQEYAKMK